MFQEADYDIRTQPHRSDWKQKINPKFWFQKAAFGTLSQNERRDLKDMGIDYSSLVGKTSDRIKAGLAGTAILAAWLSPFSLGAYYIVQKPQSVNRALATIRSYLNPDNYSVIEQAPTDVGVYVYRPNPDPSGSMIPTQPRQPSFFQTLPANSHSVENQPKP